MSVKPGFVSDNVACPVLSKGERYVEASLGLAHNSVVASEGVGL